MNSECPENGNVLFIILIAVALFAALSYAVTSSGRGGVDDGSYEKAELDQAELDSYTAAINAARMRLEIVRQCETIDYTPPSGWGVEDKRCHMFASEGGSVAYREDLNLDSCELAGGDLSTLAIGEVCGSIVYAGSNAGTRIYTTQADLPDNYFTFSYSFSGNAVSSVDGAGNTDDLVEHGGGSGAAYDCRALGEKWYLPVWDEAQLLRVNSSSIGGLSSSDYWLSTTAGPNAEYWTVAGFRSSQHPGNSASIRCVRQE